MKVIAIQKPGTSLVECTNCHALLEVTLNDLSFDGNTPAMCSFTCGNCGSQNIIPTNTLSPELDALI